MKNHKTEFGAGRLGGRKVLQSSCSFVLILSFLSDSKDANYQEYSSPTTKFL
jgi:hypothetical protein